MAVISVGHFVDKFEEVQWTFLSGLQQNNEKRNEMTNTGKPYLYYTYLTHAVYKQSHKSYTVSVNYST